MQHQYYFLSALLFLSSGNAFFTTENNEKMPEAPPPFDADLYRKDVQVFSFHGDFLYWSAQEGSLDYALRMAQDAWGPDLNYAQGSFQNAEFNMDPGFRIAASYFRAPHYWEIWGQYTRLTVRGNNSTTAPGESDQFLTGTWPQIFDTPVSRATSYIHMNYNVADFWFDRVFLPNPHLRLRFLGGFTGAWIQQFWKIFYKDGEGKNTTLSNRWSFGGGGLRTGTIVDWYWFEDIYMTAGTTFATLFGNYNNTAKQWANFNPTPAYNSSLPLRDAHFKDARMTFTGQFLIGPSYQKNFTNSRLEIFFGYELTFWSNLQESYRSTDGIPSKAKQSWINSSLLAFQGITTGGTIDF
ncbi:MAG: hypothetical protein KGI80_01060 [Verrucomicrobiota bacterium]|nr:hypothetical protein [Verrucomicrobiota bacterium]